MNVIVFEGTNEVIIASAGSLTAIVKEWFLDGKRNLDDYNVYVTDADAGFQITTSVNFSDDQMKEFDVTELIPQHLMQELIDADLLDGTKSQ